MQNASVCRKEANGEHLRVQGTGGGNVYLQKVGGVSDGNSVRKGFKKHLFCFAARNFSLEYTASYLCLYV